MRYHHYLLLQSTCMKPLSKDQSSNRWSSVFTNQDFSTTEKENTPWYLRIFDSDSDSDSDTNSEPVSGSMNLLSDEETSKANDNAKRKAENKAKRKAEEEAKCISENKARRNAEMKERRKAKKEAKRKAEEATLKKAKRKAFMEMKRKAEEEDKKEIEYIVKNPSEYIRSKQRVHSLYDTIDYLQHKLYKKDEEYESLLKELSHAYQDMANLREIIEWSGLNLIYEQKLLKQRRKYALSDSDSDYNY